MLRKIKLYGKLATFIGHRVLEADVASAAEAVRFLLANWPELEAHMNDQHYRVSIGTYDLDLEELHHPAGTAPISFVPVVAGAGAVGRIIAGVALVALAFALSAHGWDCMPAWFMCFAKRLNWRQPRPRRRRPAPNANAKGAAGRRQAKTTHVNRTHLAEFKIRHAQALRFPLFTEKRWSAV
jgi:hypothetical protein